jgi:hypothetical protein
MKTRHRLLALCISLLAGVAAAADAERRFTPEELRADFDELYQKLRAAHFDLYAYTGQRSLDSAFKDTRDALDRPMTAEQARVRFQRFAAQVRMGHTRVGSPLPRWRAYRDGGGRGFPLVLRILGGEAFVAQNLSGSNEIALGDEILELRGQGEGPAVSMGDWLERTRRHVSAETDYMANSVLEFDFPVYLWMELGPVEAFELVVRGPDGKRRPVKISARTAQEMEAARVTQPPALDLERPLREAKMLDAGTAYLKPGPFNNTEATTGAQQWDNTGFRAFIDQAFADFARAGAERLIIDLRGNPGGDNLFSDVMVAWIASRPFRFAARFTIKVSEESTAANAARIAQDAAAAGPVSHKFAALYATARPGDLVDFEIPMSGPREAGTFKGKVFVLVDRQTYSNAVAVAATIQDYSFGKILGELTSDFATTYGSMEQFELTRTGLPVSYPKARIVRPNGVQHARGVLPELRIRIPIVQDASDEVLRQAMVLARRSP